MADAMPSSRVAKVAIGLDIRGLRQQKEALKREIADIGKVKIDGSAAKALSAIMGKDAINRVGELRKGIASIGEEMRKAGQKSAAAFDINRIRLMTREMTRLNSELRQYEAALSGVAGLPQPRRGSAPSGGSGGSGGTQTTPSVTPPSGGQSGPAGRRNPIGSAFSSLRGAMATVGMGIGVGWAVGRQQELAKGGMGIRELVGGTVGGQSQYGFTKGERQERGMSIARGSGRRMSDADITGLTNQSEMLQRAHGISGEDYGRSFGAARRAGIGDEGGFIRRTVGDAGRMGMEGAKTQEYLSEMTGYLESVSKGVNVNEDSLRGFAHSLGQLDFFKADPARIFEAIKGLENTFKNPASPYQQFGTYQAIQGATKDATGRTMSAAGVEERRDIGLFGGNDKKTAKRYEKLFGKGNTMSDVYSTGGDDIMRRFLKEQYDASIQQGGGDAAASQYMFKQATGIKGEAGSELFRSTGEGKLDKKALDKARRGMQTPEQKAAANMEKQEGAILKFAARVDDFKNAVSEFINNGVMKFVSWVDKLAEVHKVFSSDIVKFGIAIAAIAGAKALGGVATGSGAGALAGGGMLGKGLLLVEAAAVGAIIGTAMRDKLDEWTKGEWSNTVDRFWNAVAKLWGGGVDTKGMDTDESRKKLIGQYGEDAVRKADKGISDSTIKAGFAYGGDKLNSKIGDELNYIQTRNADLAAAGVSEADRTKAIEKEVAERRERDAAKEAKRAKAVAQMKLLEAGKTRPQDLPDAAKNLVARGMLGDKQHEALMDEFSFLKPELQAAAAAELGDDTKAPTQAKSRGGFIGAFADGGQVPNEKMQKLAEGMKKQFGGGEPIDIAGKLKALWGSTSLGEDINTSIAAARKKKGIESHMAGGAIGTDTMMAAVTPGEFVVNARDSSKNMPALAYANAGGSIKPDFSSMPSSVDINSGTIEDALSGNTSAIQTLTKALMGSASGSPGMKQIPRGPSNVRYGRS